MAVEMLGGLADAREGLGLLRGCVSGRDFVFGLHSTYSFRASRSAHPEAFHPRPCVRAAVDWGSMR